MKRRILLYSGALICYFIAGAMLKDVPFLNLIAALLVFRLGVTFANAWCVMKFKYGDIVRVTKGFYEGQVGVVISYDPGYFSIGRWWNKTSYKIDVTKLNRDIYCKESVLEIYQLTKDEKGNQNENK
jgi:hypothetical protein